MKIQFISFPVVDQDFVWYSSAVHDVSGSYQSHLGLVIRSLGSHGGSEIEYVFSEGLRGVVLFVQ